MKFTNEIFKNISLRQLSREVERCKRSKRCKTCSIRLHSRRMTNRDFYSYDFSLHTSGHKIPIASSFISFLSYFITFFYLISIDVKIYVSRFYSRLLSYDTFVPHYFPPIKTKKELELGAYFYFFESMSLFI